MNLFFLYLSRDVSITMIPHQAPKNGTSYKIHCKCRSGSATYLTRRDFIKGTDGEPGTVAYSFSCSPQSVSIVTILCAMALSYYKYLIGK